jgi:hypothetical protein
METSRDRWQRISQLANSSQPSISGVHIIVGAGGASKKIDFLTRSRANRKVERQYKPVFH